MSLVVACGVPAVHSPPPPRRSGSRDLVIANWPLYINSNDEWFARFRSQLESGQGIGRDVTVLTDRMAARLIDLGWVEEIDRGNAPNAERLLGALQDVQFDPGRRYSLTWQSGLTGIGYNPALTGRDLTSVEDLFAEDRDGPLRQRVADLPAGDAAPGHSRDLTSGYPQPDAALQPRGT